MKAKVVPGLALDPGASAAVETRPNGKGFGDDDAPADSHATTGLEQDHHPDVEDEPRIVITPPVNHDHHDHHGHQGEQDPLLSIDHPAPPHIDVSTNEASPPTAMEATSDVSYNEASAEDEAEAEAEVPLPDQHPHHDHHDGDDLEHMVAMLEGHTSPVKQPHHQHHFDREDFGDIPDISGSDID